MRLNAILLCSLILVLALAGCGGGGGSSSATGSTSTSTEAESSGEATGKKEAPSAEKAAFVKAGDKICSEVPTHYGKKLAALEKANGGKKLPQAEANQKAAVPPLYTAIEEFEALSPPSGEEAEVEAIIAALEGAAKGIEENPTSELAGPKSPFAEFTSLTTKFGMQVCPQL